MHPKGVNNRVGIRIVGTPEVLIKSTKVSCNGGDGVLSLLVSKADSPPLQSSFSHFFDSFLDSLV
uniref:Uncharacterized protein n=1 Tax=Lepeophtheirus salmonis TaxID=72036 RepID=A0A0K2TZI4_LEPSM